MPERSSAFLRLESPADLHDASLIALSGADLAFEPVGGALGGNIKPTQVTGIHRVGNRDELRISRRTWTIKVVDNSESIAMAILALVSTKRAEENVLIDCTAIEPGSRAEVVCNGLVGLANCLTYRAQRVLSETDIIALMEWVASMTSAAVVAQVPYGAPHWGAMMRGESSTPHLGMPTSRVRIPRTLACHVRPSLDDLERLFAWMTREAGGFGIVNLTAARGLVPWCRGISTDRAALMGNHTIINRPIFAECADSDEELFVALRAAGRASYETRVQIHPALQPVWAHQDALLRSCVVTNPGWVDPAIFGNHVTYGAIQAAQGGKGMMPVHCGSVGDGVFKVNPMAVPKLIDDLLERWDECVSASFEMADS